MSVDYVGASSRNVNVDLVKSVAIFCVVAVHFLLNAGFYDVSLHGLMGYVLTVARTALMVCVPLFLITTGYLMKNKRLSVRYYLGVLRVLVIYIVASALCMVWRIAYFGVDYNIFGFVRAILDYTACSYSWYVEMYLGLYLIIPFLNALYQGLDDRRSRRNLIVTLLLVVSVPLQLNFGWQILPEWWSNALYPILYYFVGSYLRDYPPDKRIRDLAAFLVLWVAACSAFNYLITIRAEGNLFVKGGFNGWGSLENVISAATLFVLLLHVRLPNCRERVGVALACISRYSFGAYLLSWLFDKTAYPLLLEWSGEFFSLLPLAPLVVSLIFCGATALSSVVTEFSERLASLVVHGVEKCLPDE